MTMCAPPRRSLPFLRDLIVGKMVTPAPAEEEEGEGTARTRRAEREAGRAHPENVSFLLLPPVFLLFRRLRGERERVTLL